MRLHLGSYFHSVGVREGESQRRVGRRRETLGDGKACFHGGCPCSVPVSTGVWFQFLRILSDTYFPSADLLVLIITFLVGVNSAPS